MDNKLSYLQPIPEEESTEDSLVRLVRCMNPAEKCELAYNAVEILSRRCSLDPDYSPMRDKPEDLEEELKYDLAHRIRASWSWDEPTAHWMNFENMGDPRFSIEDAFERPPAETVDLLFWTDSYEEEASDAAQRYLSDARENAILLPCEFSENPLHEEWTEEDERDATDRFIKLFRYWRERLIQTLERQNPGSMPL